jgi:hypothetical protein
MIYTKADTVAAEPKAWMSVSLFCVLLSCVQTVALQWADLCPRSPTDCVKRLRNWKSGQGPTKDCRATDRQIYTKLIYKFLSFSDILEEGLSTNNVLFPM